MLRCCGGRPAAAAAALLISLVVACFLCGQGAARVVRGPSAARSPAQEQAMARIRTARYLRECHLDTKGALFAATPGNFLWNDRFKFKFFEIPKSGAAEFKFPAAHMLLDTTAVHQGAWTPGHLQGPTPAGPTFDADEYVDFTIARDPVDRFVAVVNLFHAVERQQWNELTGDTGGGEDGMRISKHRAIDAVLKKLRGEGWFNWHFWPQALYLAGPNGQPRTVDHVFNRDKMDEVFNTLERDLGTPHVNASHAALRKLLDEEGKAKGFWEPRLFTPEVVRREDLLPEHVRHVCNMYLVDFCCFYFRMPDVCVDALGAESTHHACSSHHEATGRGRLYLTDKGSSAAFDLDSVKPAHLYPGARKFVDSLARRQR